MKKFPFKHSFSHVDFLRRALARTEEAYEQYGAGFELVGQVLDVLFPEGIALMTPEDHTRMHIFEWMVGKLVRYAQNYDRGGHSDSLTDLASYSCILQALDHHYNHLPRGGSVIDDDCNPFEQHLPDRDDA